MLTALRVALATLLVSACASRAPASATTTPTPATPAQAPAAEGVHGVLVLPPGVSEPTGGDVFVTVYAESQGRWRVVAVDRLPVTAWPLAFDIGVEQQMLAGGPAIAGPVRILAWIDHDGDACTFQEGDREGVLETVAPAAGLTIPLDVLHATDVPNRCAT